MTNLVSRILLAILLMPLSAILYFTAAMVLLPNLDEKFAFLWMHVFVGFFIVLYWLALWGRSVRWTRWRKGMTVLSGVACVTAALGFGVFVASMVPYEGEVLGVLIGGFVAIVLWLVASVILWRETAAERAERVRQAAGEALFCPRCGYNMTGLYEGRCPECGARFTLDQLYAAQRQSGLEEVTASRTSCSSSSTLKGL